MKSIISFLITLFWATGVIAQAEKSSYRPFQLTFISPLGTNGIESPQIDNQVSINMLIGVNGGVGAFEMGGLGNWNQGAVRGFQIAGLTNIVRGQVVGAQVGGIYNLSQQHQKGFQAAGIANTNLESSQGLTMAGIGNFQNGNRGAALAGIANVNSLDLYGAQIAGITNVTAGRVNGAQIAGITNIAVNPVKGFQMSGIYNYTSRLEGVQLSLINYTDSLTKGTPIGFISVVAKNGYRRLEFEANETFYGNLIFKTGIKHFYNIFAIGGSFKDIGYWGPGYGLGSAWDVNEKLGMNVDLVTYQVNEGESWTNALNLMNRIKVNFSYPISSKITVVGGPVYILSISKIKDSEGNLVGGSYVPGWTLRDQVWKSTRVTSYLGFNLGLRL